jgi:CDP-diacylglycerol--serine O-phosphatidyltransferase
MRLKNRRKRKIFKHLTLARVLPNLATLSALLVGLAQIRFSISGKWGYVILSSLGASFLDMTDGRLARFMNSSSRFGAELDSLSDFVVFGICPAFVIYIFCGAGEEELSWMSSMFYCVCMCLRLARFNTHDIEKKNDPSKKNDPISGRFFVGVPAPAGAMLALLPVVMYNAFHLEIFRSQFFGILSLIVSGSLCISKIPTFSTKEIQVKKENYTSFMLLAALIVCVVFMYTWKALCVAIFAYCFSIFFSWKKSKSIVVGSNVAE